MGIKEKAPAKGIAKAVSSKKVALKNTARKAVLQPISTKRSSSKSKQQNSKNVSKKSASPKPLPKTKFTTKAKPVLVKTDKLTSLSKNRSLLVLSPFRFPLDVDKLATQTARFGGVFFVVVGAIMTLFFSNQLFSAEINTPMTAAVLSTSDNQLQILSQQPQVTSFSQEFEINGSDPIQGTVDISFSLVTKPISAKLRAKNIKTNVVSDFGDFSPKDDQNWQYRLDSHLLPDGAYRFQALVKYESIAGTYYTVEVTDSLSRMIENDVIESVSDSSVSESTADNSVESDDSVIEALPVDDSLETGIDSVLQTTSLSSLRGNLEVDDVLSGIERITVFATGAERVKIELLALNSTPIGLGYATKVSTDEWRFSFDTTTRPDGDYKLRALLIRSTQNLLTNSVSVSISNQELVTDESEEDEDVVPEEISSNIEPEIQVELIDEEPLSGVTPVTVSVTGANYVELYSLSKNSATQRYLGLPKAVDSETWSFNWNTAAVPNGEYKILAKVRTPYGFFTEESDSVKVYNLITTTQTEAEIKYQETIEAIATETAVSLQKSFESTAEEFVDDLVTLGVSPEDKQTLDERLTALMSLYKDELDEELDLYSLALRKNETELTEKVLARITDIVKDIKQAALIQPDSELLIKYIDLKIESTLQRIRDNVAKTNTLLTERTEAEATKDTDGDGITDYDEVAIYKTNPFVADSDNDGFTDGAEVLSGYDPTDATPEVAVKFESPKEVGVVRDDILSVDTVSTEQFPPEEATNAPPVAIITGKALPNSFATLYIFSTPIVVTIKTESDGSWLYRFDRELEDGEHEVYVGITDNAGKVIAKSNPFSFVKEAQAFSPVESPVSGAIVVTPDDKNILSGAALFVVASISIVAIGLVLILLGIYMDNRKKIYLTDSAAAPTASA